MCSCVHHHHPATKRVNVVVCTYMAPERQLQKNSAQLINQRPAQDQTEHRKKKTEEPRKSLFTRGTKSGPHSPARFHRPPNSYQRPRTPTGRPINRYAAAASTYQRASVTRQQRRSFGMLPAFLLEEPVRSR